MKQKPLFLALKGKRVFDEIADQIKNLIYSGVFRPGDKLPSQRELASQFNVGHMVVREALRVLEQSGLIYMKQGSQGGGFIKEADTTVMTNSISDRMKIGNVSLKHLTEVRLGIEQLVLELAMQRITDEDLERLRKNIAETDAIVSKGGRSLKLNVEFHLLLGSASKNPLFEMIVESVMNVFDSFLEPMKPDIEYGNEVLASHKAIYAAIKDRNVPAAHEIMEKHLLHVNNRLLSNVRNNNGKGKKSRAGGSGRKGNREGAN